MAAVQALAQPVSVSMSADEITQTVVGKVCTNKPGAQFTFSGDGHYGYVGLWNSSGHYQVNDGAVTVLFDNGMERVFAISRRGDVVYIEETAISCK